MKFLLLIWLLFLPSSKTESLFDNIEFNEYGIGYKTDILVEYVDIGKTNNIENIKLRQKKFKSTTSLTFIYGNNEYYIPIEENKLPDFISTIDKGRFLIIDIVVLDTKICKTIGKTKNIYCAYINKIQQCTENNLNLK